MIYKREDFLRELFKGDGIKQVNPKDVPFIRENEAEIRSLVQSYYDRFSELNKYFFQLVNEDDLYQSVCNRIYDVLSNRQGTPANANIHSYVRKCCSTWMGEVFRRFNTKKMQEIWKPVYIYETE